MKCTFIVFLATFALSNAQNAAKCNKECLANYAQCVTSTTFKACLPGVQVFDDIQTCKEGTFCSDAADVCVPANTTNVEFICGTGASSGGDTDTCNQCGANDTITCVDKTHFTLCNNRNTYVQCDTANEEECSNEVYSVFGKICVKKSALDAIGITSSCSSTVTTASTERPTTPSLDDAAAACAANKDTTVSWYFIPNSADSTCKTYYYCEYSGNLLRDARGMICGDGKLYDNAAQTCLVSTVAVPNCDSNVPTTTAAPAAPVVP